MSRDVYELRVNGFLVTQEELSRQDRNHPHPTLPNGIARYLSDEAAFTCFKWLRRQYPDQEVTLTASLYAKAKAARLRAQQLEDEAVDYAESIRADAVDAASAVMAEEGVRGRTMVPAELVRHFERGGGGA